MKRIGLVAYELKLLEDWKLHNVSHVSLLKKYISNPNYVLFELSKATLEEKLLAESE